MNSRPANLSEVIGQERIKQVLNTLIKSAKIRKRNLPHILIYSPPGRGKTSLAFAIAKEMGTHLFLANGASLKDPDDLYSIIRAIKPFDILFIDEIHSMKPKVAEWFYTVMEDFSFYKTDGSEIKLPPFTVLGATTHMGTIPEPLRTRFKFSSSLEDYSEEELIQMVHFVLHKENLIQMPNDVARLIAKTCRDTPRILVNHTEFIRDFMLANGLTSLKKNRVLEIIRMQGVDEEGYTDIDRQYLQILKEQAPLSLRQISAKLGIDEKAVMGAIEPLLLKRRKIEITNKGRWLTESRIAEEDAM